MRNIFNKADQLPHYISQVPWYVNQGNQKNIDSRPSTSNFKFIANNNKLNNKYNTKSEDTTLSHQMLTSSDKEKLPITVSTIRGVSSVVNKKFKKGACENCGATTHTKKFCFERPRAKEAKFTGENIQNDEFIIERELDYDAKHDIWDGYDPEVQRKYILEYQYAQEQKLKAQLEELEKIEKEDLIKLKKSYENGENLNEDDVDNLEKIKKLEELIKENDDKSSNDEDDNEDLEGLNIKSMINEHHFQNAITRPLSKSAHLIDDYKKYMLNLNTENDGKGGKDDTLLEEFNLNKELYDRKTGDAIKFLESEEFIKKVNERNKDLNVSIIFKLIKFYY